MICKSCGQALAENTKVCPICKTVQDGVAIHDDEYKINEIQEISGKQAEHIGDNTDVQMQQSEQTAYNSIFEDEPVSSIYEGKYPYVPRSRVLAGILQIFLGGFGIGRFYLGYNKIALGQLFTMPIFFIGNIWGIIDGILILCGQVECDANGIPLKQ